MVLDFFGAEQVEIKMIKEIVEALKFQTYGDVGVALMSRQL